MSHKKPTEPYEVGYGKPPMATRFKPGQSGNRKGRPKRSKSSAVLIDGELNQTIIIHENGKKLRVTKREAIHKQLVNGAIKGDIRKIELLMRWGEKHATPEPFVLNEQDQFELLQALKALNVQEGKPDAKP